MRRALPVLFLCASCGSSTEPASVVPTASTSAGAAPTAAPSASAPVAAKEPIGQIKMEADGTLVMDLYRPAMAQFRYPPGHAEYASVKDHVGPIKPGETKLVPPWPDEFDEKKAEAAARAWAKTKTDWGGDTSLEIVGTRGKDVVVNVWSKTKRRQVTLDPVTYAVKAESEL